MKCSGEPNRWIFVVLLGNQLSMRINNHFE